MHILLYLLNFYRPLSNSRFIFLVSECSLSSFIVVVDSGRLLEPHDFTVPGERRALDIAGLITDIGYEVSVYGVTKMGYRATPLTTVAVTGTPRGPSLRLVSSPRASFLLLCHLLPYAALKMTLARAVTSFLPPVPCSTEWPPASMKLLY
uniref:Uncharacterized protein n=1 Tax=Erpetoichthys calabaricus TaxID=27687 RepID=A0A8C4TAD9_ERPCA